MLKKCHFSPFGLNCGFETPAMKARKSRPQIRPAMKACNEGPQFRPAIQARKSGPQFRPAIQATVIQTQPQI